MTKSDQKDKARPILISTGAGAITFAGLRVPVPSGDKRLAAARISQRIREGSSIEFFPTRIDTAISLADKEQFARRFKNKAIPTIGLEQIVKSPKLTQRQRERALRTIHKFTGGQFVIKPKDTAVTNIKDLITDKTPKSGLKKAFKNPKNFLLQPRLKIKSEYRVTFSAGKVTSVFHRRLPGSTSGFGSVLPVFGKERRNIKNFVEKAFRSRGIKEGSGVLGIDVAKTGKGLRLIEANVSPGDIRNPLKSQFAKFRATGRASKGFALAAGVGVAAFVGFKLAKGEKTYKNSRGKGRVVFRNIGGRIVPIKVG